jgi:hypothetical protein
MAVTGDPMSWKRSGRVLRLGSAPKWTQGDCGQPVFRPVRRRRLRESVLKLVRVWPRHGHAAVCNNNNHSPGMQHHVE